MQPSTGNGTSPESSSTDRTDRGAIPFADNSEFLQAYEDELVLRARLYFARAGRTTSEQEQEQRRLLAEIVACSEQRKRRSAVTRRELPLERIAATLGLSATEERLLAYLLILQECDRLAQYMEQTSASRREAREARVAMSIAADEPGGWLAARRVLAADSALVTSGFLAPLAVSRTDVLSEVRLQLTVDGVAALLDDRVTIALVSSGLRVDRPIEQIGDLVLAADTKALLARLGAEWAEWGRGISADCVARVPEHLTYGTAPVVLFHGLPGTGKTLAARALAGTIGRPLVQVGEEAANEGMFASEETCSVAIAEAQRIQGVVFLDEVDKLFDGVRGLAERPLLSALESARTPVILATNSPERVFYALTRRLLHTALFPMPAEPQRAELWARHLPAIDATRDVPIDRLAKSYWMSGGAIKNAAIDAIRTASAHAPVGSLPVDFASIVEHAARAQFVNFARAFEPFAELLPPTPSDPPGTFGSGVAERVARTVEALCAARPFDHAGTIVVSADRETARSFASYLAYRTGRMLFVCDAPEDDSLRSSQGGPDVLLFRSVLEGAPRQFGVLAHLVSKGEHAFELARQSLRDMQQGAAFTILVTADQTHGTRVPIEHLVHLTAVRRPESALQDAATRMGLALGSIDWRAVERRWRAMDCTPVSLCSLALAESHLRGAERLETSDFVRAIELRTSLETPRYLFGRRDT